MNKIFIFLAITSLFACKESEVDHDMDHSGKSSIQLHFSQSVDSSDLVYSTDYSNAAKNVYQVSNLEYFISKIEFLDDDGKATLVKDYQYVNPLISSTLKVNEIKIPNGHYNSIRFVFGIDSEKNIKFGLPQDPYNIDMEWPEQLGGGYHFMRLEGKFKDSTNAEKAYVIHLGKTPNQVSFTFPKHVDLHDTSLNLTINMNVNNWFNGDSLIDLNDNYTSIMDKQSAQIKFKANAQKVFRIK